MSDDWNVYGIVSVHAMTYPDGVVRYYIIAHFEYDDSWEQA